MVQPTVKNTSAVDGYSVGTYDLHKHNGPGWLGPNFGDDVYVAYYNDDDKSIIAPLSLYWRRDLPINRTQSINELYIHVDKYTRWILNNNLKANLYTDKNGNLRKNTSDEKGKEIDAKIDSPKDK